MESRTWDRVQLVFAEVVDLPPSDRAAALDRLCGDDEPLAKAVGEMLAEDGAAQPLLDSSLRTLAGETLANDHLRRLVRQQIGPYRLDRLLGEGGMGVVYLAERSDIGGSVAIKLLRDGWLSPMRRERFALERQLLGRLNHRSIARIYDAGTLDDGVPWFVMEYVDGVPFTQFVAERNGTLRQDLLLFREICEAVLYAHQHAIIHRDLKPSNILATPSAEIKLLDFGIAKPMEAGGEQRQTVAALRVMTPAYAAPEQRRDGEIGVFTDVFALGLLLCELLTGAAPGDGESRRPSLLGASRESSRFHALTRREWADLDALCVTATEEEPSRRYRSVDALLGDLDAFLEGRPLATRPPLFSYTAAKYIRRHRPALAGVAAGLIIVVAAGALFAAGLARSRNAAVAEAARTARIQRFTQSLFDGGDPGAGPAAEMKVIDLPRRGEAEAESLRDDPRMQADLFATLGEVYQRLGQLDHADQLMQRVLDQRRRQLGEQDRQVPESLVSLGLLRKDQGRMEEAEALLRQALARQRQSLRTDDPALTHTLWALGSVLNLRGKYKESGPFLEEAMRGDSQGNRRSTQLADDLVQLGDMHLYLGQYAEAEPLYNRALTVYRSFYGNRHPTVAHTLNSLGDVEENRGETAKAEANFREALAIDEGWYGGDHPEVAADLTSLAQILSNSHRQEEAHALLERALAIQQKTYGDNHSRVASAFNALGTLAYVRDLDEEAETEFHHALAIWTKVYGEHHQFVGLSYANLAGVYQHEKNYPAAEAMCRKALAIYAETLPEEHLSPAVVHVKLGRILLREERYADAEPETLKGYRYFAAHGAPNDSYLLGARKDLSLIETHLNHPERAEQLRAALEAKLK